ncbi:argonaute-like protein [Panaeolus papilionaceus]|nr:argonaute-like protein [Panaeolus papilionaceus]
MPPRVQPHRGRGQPRSVAGSAGRGRGAAGEASSGAESIAGHIDTVGVRRQGVGVGGRAINIKVNAFEARVTDEVIRHYDVLGVVLIFSSAIDDDKLPPRVNLQLWVTLMEKTAPQVFAQGKIPFDGRKNAYATYELPLGPTNSGTFQIPITPAKAGKAPRLRTIKITRVAEINTELLHRFIGGKQSQDNAVSTAIMALNVAIQMEPKRNYPFNVRSFFTPDGSRNIGKGLALWRGYFQSIRPAVGRMYVNVDIATALMYKPGPLIPVVLDYFEFRDSDFPRLQQLTDPARERQRLLLSRFLMGVRMSLSHAKREISIKSVSNKSALTAKFQDREGKTISVADYFRALMGKPLAHPQLPCIEVGNGALFPMEVCSIVPGQFCRRSIPSDKTTDMVEFSKSAPSARLDLIAQKGRQLLSYGQSEYVRQFGIDISANVMDVRARVLDAPAILYSNPRDIVRPRDGAWNLRSQKLYRPVEIGDWALVIFEERRFNMSDAQAMAKDFVDNAKVLGIKFTGKSELPLAIEFKNGQGNISAAMKQVGKQVFDQTKKPPSLMVAVLPDMGNAGMYIGVKHFGDIEMGVPTQCLKAGKCKRAKPQYWANVVNAKMGGINSILQQHPLVDPNHPTIVMGADVKHPSPGTEGKPSFSALVSSFDSLCTRYTAISRAQTGRVEIIADLKEMCLEAFTIASSQPGAKRPTRLIFYRDGVSEGQFAQVLRDEVPLIKAACAEKNINPKLTFIIVGKRHHIRFFPSAEGPADRTGNCLAGTTVDTGIAHPTEFDYYQLTHGGLLGTSRPSHYSVLVDENKFNADGLQRISFALCHVYARATRSVSIPAPVYYADIVCARSNTHYNPDLNYDLSESGTVQGGAEESLQRYKTNFKKLHASMVTRMYFM